MMPLVFARENEIVEVVKIETGHGIHAKLMEMGIIPGAKIRMVCNAKGPVIIAVNDSKYALGKGIASKIIVRRTNG